jgi:voltage-gated potassium channel Kch
VTPAAAARARAGAAAPLRQPIAPRRVSGPSRHPRAVPLAPSSRRHLLARLLDAPLLDRLIRGRTWIAFVAFALLGIVAMQVAILRLGASIGRSVSQIEQLTQQNETTATSIAALEPRQNSAAEAAALDMVYPPDNNIVYLGYNAQDATLAAASISAPTVPLAPPASAGVSASTTPSSSANTAGSTTLTSTQTTPAQSTTTSAAATGTTGSTSATTTNTPGSTSDSTTTTTTTPASSTGAPTSTPGGAVSAEGGSSAPAVGGTG